MTKREKEIIINKYKSCWDYFECWANIAEFDEDSKKMEEIAKHAWCEMLSLVIDLGLYEADDYYWESI